MEKQDLAAILRENLEDGKLPCEKAYSIAAEYGIKLWLIGQVCDEENIKVKGCQLGCF